MARAPRNRRRTPLNRERIAAAGTAIVDKKGLDALSFRTLGKRLKCEPMSLYYYPSKQHLLDAMVSICLAETPVPPPGPPMRERIARIACATGRPPSATGASRRSSSPTG